MDLKIKGEHGDKFVAFGNKGRVLLKDRAPEDLVKLAIIARKSGDRSILNLFDGELPGLQELQDADNAWEKEQAAKNSLNAPKKTAEPVKATGPAAVNQKPATANTQDTNNPAK